MKKQVKKIRLKVGDLVQVRAGGQRFKNETDGTYKTGKVVAVHPRDNTVTVEGINIYKRHLKPSRQNPQGGIEEITKPIAVSKLGIYDPTAKRPSRITYKVANDGTKKRVFQKSDKEVK